MALIWVVGRAGRGGARGDAVERGSKPFDVGPDRGRVDGVTRVPQQTGQGPTDDSFEKDKNEIKFYLQLMPSP